VAISFDSARPGDAAGVSIHLEAAASSEELATIALPNCRLLPDTQAKYTSAKRRLTLRCAPRGGIRRLLGLQHARAPLAPAAPASCPTIAIIIRQMPMLPGAPHAASIAPPASSAPCRPRRMLITEGMQASDSVRSANSFEFLEDDDVEDSPEPAAGAAEGARGWLLEVPRGGAHAGAAAGITLRCSRLGSAAASAPPRGASRPTCVRPGP
jgi:hypothetical protein